MSTVSAPKKWPAVWRNAVRAAPDPKLALHYFEELGKAPGAGELRRCTAEQARILAALFSGSPAMSERLLAQPDWLEVLQPEGLRHPRQAQGLRREMKAWVDPLQARRYDEAIGRVRQFKQREMLRIAARDLARLAGMEEVTLELSSVADVCLEAVLQACQRRMQEQLGRPYHQLPNGEWVQSEFAIISLGKAGGQELNYSSDVDIIFLYSEEGHVFKEHPGKSAPTERAMTSHAFYKRMAENFIAEVTRATDQGVLYRLDLRLRPEGDAGPLVRSLAGYENYYAQWGQPWERMMLIKARCTAGGPAIGAEFLEMIQPFRYPRSLTPGFVREIAAMKDRIEEEVVRAGELQRNVKLGRGGIREIEFIVQTLQVLHGGRIPFLQGSQTLPMLQKLVEYNFLSASDAAGLREAYCFLRGLEHRLQMEQNLQTHTLPTEISARRRLAALMGCSSLKSFESALKGHTGHVRTCYERLLKSDQSREPAAIPRDFQDVKHWQAVLGARRFRDVPKAIKLLSEFVHGPGFGHVSPRTIELAFQLIGRLLAVCPGSDRPVSDGGAGESNRQAARWLSDPDRVVTRLDSFISAYGSRAMLFEIWTSNPSLFDLMLFLFDRSEFLAEVAIRTPDLVDELVTSDRLRRRKTAVEILEDLRHGRDDKDQLRWIRRYHQAELMRIALRDILALADSEQNLVELTALAEACLQYALEVTLRKHKFKGSPLVIVGLGKLGGEEISYGSDLDVVFVADATRDLPRLQRVAVEVKDLLSSPTEFGTAFATDARLRPDGEKGLLANSLDAYEDYYRRRAQLWEIQALSRCRAVAGNMQLGARFETLARALTNFKSQNVAAGFPALAGAASRAGSAGGKTRHSGLVAYSPDWKQVIAKMRLRIERERTPAGQDELAIKTGAGGLMDAEFIAQALCLENGWHEPNTLCALLRAQETGALERPDASRLIDNYRSLRRIECILRRWSYVGETVLPVDPAPYYRVSVRCGFATPEAFREAIAGYRREIREVYSSFFAG